MKSKSIFIVLILLLIAGIIIWFMAYRPRVQEERIATAVNLARAGDCPAAVVALKALSIPTETIQGIEAGLWLARCQTELKNYLEAKILWDEIALRDDPAVVEEAEFYQGLIAEAEGESNEAEKKFQAFLSRYPDSSRRVEVLLTLARIDKEKGASTASHDLYREILESDGNEEMIDEARRELAAANFAALFSPGIGEESLAYTVRGGDSLFAIARAYNTTPELLKKINNLNGDIIHPEQVLKVPRQEFSAVVSKSRNTLRLFYGDELFKEYSVGTGRNNCSPTGEFTIVTKLVNPPWIKGGETIPPFDPRNILGTRWMGFSDPYASFGIHGTTKPKTVGRQSSDGCIRMINEDVEELFNFLPRGTKVIIEE
ncbi:MAG: L,D-transpeptidase family protein [Candidatus Auribacterota bacterium]|nr:L,D-transpeptidase family protein [Candidatus Auribacterota bacterium]